MFQAKNQGYKNPYLPNDKQRRLNVESGKTDLKNLVAELNRENKTLHLQVEQLMKENEKLKYSKKEPTLNKKTFTNNNWEEDQPIDIGYSRQFLEKNKNKRIGKLSPSKKNQELRINNQVEKKPQIGKIINKNSEILSSNKSRSKIFPQNNQISKSKPSYEKNQNLIQKIKSKNEERFNQIPENKPTIIQELSQQNFRRKTYTEGRSNELSEQQKNKNQMTAKKGLHITLEQRKRIAKSMFQEQKNHGSIKYSEPKIEVSEVRKFESQMKVPPKQQTKVIVLKKNNSPYLNAFNPEEPFSKKETRYAPRQHSTDLHLRDKISRDEKSFSKKKNYLDLVRRF